MQLTAPLIKCASIVFRVVNKKYCCLFVFMNVQSSKLKLTAKLLFASDAAFFRLVVRDRALSTRRALCSLGVHQRGRLGDDNQSLICRCTSSSSPWHDSMSRGIINKHLFYCTIKCPLVRGALNTISIMCRNNKMSSRSYLKYKYIFA